MTKHQVYQLRERHGLTQWQFARLCWTSEGTVASWENGRTRVDPARFELAANNINKGKGDKIALEQVQERRIWEEEQ